MLTNWKVSFLYYRDKVRFLKTRGSQSLKETTTTVHLFPHSDLKKVLVWEVVSGIDLKDEDMVDSGLSPSVCVDAQQEDELDQQETAAIDPHQWPHVLEADEHSTW